MLITPPANMWNGAVIVLLMCSGVFGIVDYCSEDVFTNSEHFMQFTKEATNAEYATIGKFKGLHCCAKGYRSIEWYKDDKPYPWPGTASQLILYPESANQTIYTHTITADDAGNYTCLLRNDSLVHRHTIELKVFEKAPDKPKLTYISPATNVMVGRQGRLFCEAFAGVVDLPDAHNEAIWRKEGDNTTFNDEARIRQKKVSREDGEIFGTYLIIDSVTEEDYGNYICTITKPGKSIELLVELIKLDSIVYIDPNPVPWRKLTIGLTVMCLIAVTLAILNMRFGLRVRVRVKDQFGRPETNDGKTSDLMIVYAEKDAPIALGVLLPTLESRYQYRCSCRVLPSNVTTWYSDLMESASKSRRILAVTSPAVLNDNWDAAKLCMALKQLNMLGPKLTCVLLKELPSVRGQIKDAEGQNLATLLRTINVINWDRSNTERFWLSLRLRLPSQRSLTRSQLDNSRLTTDSQESLDILV